MRGDCIVYHNNNNNNLIIIIIPEVTMVKMRRKSKLISTMRSIG